jgi:hypothetical protein
MYQKVEDLRDGGTLFRSLGMGNIAVLLEMGYKVLI